MALWVIRPPARQRLGELERQGVRLRVTSVVLREIPARTLLAHARTVCFAAGADAGGLSDAELCTTVVARLQEVGASRREFEVAAVLAATAGRYDAMISAVRAANVDTVILEDLVHFGEDRGFERGLEQGRERGRAEGRAELLIRQTGHRFGALDPALVARVRGGSADELDQWAERILAATSLAELFGDD